MSWGVRPITKLWNDKDKIISEKDKIISNLQKKNQSLNERFVKIRDNKEIIEEIQIPNEPIIITANNTETIISKTVNGENLCAEFGNIGKIDKDNLNKAEWKTCDSHLATMIKQGVNNVVNAPQFAPNNVDVSIGGKYKKNSKLEKKKTFRYRIKRNKLGRFVKGKTRKSHL